MSTASSLFVVAILAIFSVTNGIKVTVFYEALCPDSVDFITRQLRPHYSDISKYVDLDLVPYGKAAHSNQYGSWQFSCQHGPSECQGNKYQACGLAQKAGSETNVKFVDCVMRSGSAWNLNTVEKCARRFNLNVQKLQSCATSSEGDALLGANGNKTPSLAFVPTIIYDNIYDHQAQEQSLKDFVAVVCSKINEPKPSVCNNRQLPALTPWGMGYYY